MFLKGFTLLGLALATYGRGFSVRRQSQSLEDCPGYAASNVQDDGSKITADLTLAGAACNVYGEDISNLKLEVVYQTESRLHVKIYDADEQVYQVPEDVFPRPVSKDIDPSDSALEITWVEKPFSFAIRRRDSNETLFDTSAASFIFESQYLRLRTSLPEAPHLYGLGEHTDPFHLNTTNYTRTQWNRDAYGTPEGRNLYGHHAIYFDHRGANGTNGVFLLNSNGMDIKIDDTDGQFLEYNTLGGIVDLYFFAGPTPKEVSAQYAEVAGFSAMQPYWGLGFHQCKYGYRDVFHVAEVVANYSVANIPLETMWTDIDYMYLRKVFTLDPERFQLPLVRQLVDHLHAHQQHYVVMVDPAVSTRDNDAYSKGVEANIFHQYENGSLFQGVVWPGPTVFPDWFHPDTQKYWDDQFLRFFDAETGVDIDALWIDMNEAANFCPFPCADPDGFADEAGNPPDPPPVRNNSARPAIPGFPQNFQPTIPTRRSLTRRQYETGKAIGLPGRDLLNPKYTIGNLAGSISNLTVRTDIINYGGSAQYDTHNLYGSMMSVASRNALLARRPGRRPLVITRSTFAGAGAHVGKWLGDNLSQWDHYRISIAQMLEFAALYQVPMVGADVCGFGGNTTETLCARWSMLGAFYPFFRNHAQNDAVFQEFYQWPTVAEAARNTIAIRYRLLDYIYTHFHRQSTTGVPLLNPLYFLYPEDSNTFTIDLQFFWGDDILVSPVTEENSTAVSIYLPNDTFYDFYTHEKVEGTGSYVNLTDVPFTKIPLHVRGGSIIALRAESANTTTELRKQDFVLWIAPNATGHASGSLYLDEGDAIEQPETSEIQFTYDNGSFKMTGSFGYPTDNVIADITILGQPQAPKVSLLQEAIPLTEEWSRDLDVKC
ncbi:glycoside hydrolase family 31 protein [Aaosphaeria arxii CBS 175.79]|uniref:Glycoside hydrolase family 31 protein n=1 Tax=Aaosphaeria arxii CBS 175.79 TaxID=1450172 RepID=A0A6A5XED5_9PLEO|nr:glycoside hydrolase family 31 protein [Aaosphaeria arxii CBS 175.79]KAF2011418.1 glycoside hydrolase family 31 protein [Aaosphaeria arxii CBS 175.79]